MRSRSIYSKPKYGTLQQGDIFNCGKAKEYGGKLVYGLIITPRCDISNSKVSDLHYLPLVKIEDWLEKEGLFLFLSQVRAKLSSKILNIFSTYKIEPSILQTTEISRIIEVFAPIMKPKDAGLFKNLLKDLQVVENNRATPNKSEWKSLLTDNRKELQNIITEIMQFKRKEYYLLEDWENTSALYVVIMREIRLLPFQLANEISKGLLVTPDTKDIHESIELYPPEEEYFLQIFSTLKSPFIEHLIQHFYSNFGRIGVEDYKVNVTIQIEELCA